MGVYMGNTPLTIYNGGQPSGENVLTEVERQEDLLAEMGEVIESVALFGEEELYITPGTETIEYVPQENYMYSKVTVESVPVQTKNIIPANENQTVLPDEGKFLSEVIVTGDSNFLEENIAEGITLWGKTGTHKGGIEIQNGKTVNYISFSEDVEPNNFIEITEKQSDESEVAQTSFNISPNRVFQDVEGQWYLNSSYVLDCVEYSENKFIIAVSENVNPGYNNSSGKNTAYIHFELITINENSISKLVSTNTEVYSVIGGQFFKYNNVIYFDCFSMTTAQGLQDWESYSRTCYLNNFKLSISTSSISATNYRHSAGSTTEYALPNEMVLDSRGYLHFGWTVNGGTGNWYAGAFSISSTSTSNTITKTGSDYQSAFRVVLGLSGEYVAIMGVYSGSTFTDGVYKVSGSNYVLQTTESIEVTLRDFDNPSLFSTSSGLQTKIYDGKNLTTFSNKEDAKIYEFDFSNDPYITSSSVSISGIINDEFLIVYGKFVGDTNWKYGYYKIESDGQVTFLAAYSTNCIFRNFKGYYNSTPYLVLLEPHIVMIPCIKKSTSKVDGFTKTLCTTSTAGEVCVLNN